MAIGFLSVYNELLCVVISTHAINRLSTGMVAPTGAKNVVELFHADRALRQHWLGTYIHFMLGVFGIVIAGGIRGWLAVGPRFGTPLLAFTAAMVTRLLAAVNRGVVAQEFGSGNFAVLLVHFLRTFAINTLSQRRWMDMFSVVMLTLAFCKVSQRAWELFVERADGEFGDGDGVVTLKEASSYAKGVVDELNYRRSTLG